MKQRHRTTLPHIEPLVMLATVIQWLVLAIATGAVVGTGVSLFLIVLFHLSYDDFTLPLQWHFLLLPLGGLANGLLLYYGYRLNRTPLEDHVISAVHDQQGRMPLKTLPIKPLAALITLAVGGSAGKEGPCSHLGGSLASGLGHSLRLNSELQKRLVACGVSAGFASVFGTPIAGAIYGVEVLAIGRIRHDFLLPAIVAGVSAFLTSQFWNVPYEHYVVHFSAAFNEWIFIKTIFIGVFCGLAARLYVDSVKYSSLLFGKLKAQFRIWPPLLPTMGGLLLAILIIWIPTDYLGLSLPILDQALAGAPMPLPGFIFKALLVAITLGSGFYGGVVTPQFVIGALAGNAIATYLGLDPAAGAAIGLVSVMAAASNTPIAAILMGVELFGSTGLVYSAGAAMSAYLLIGHRSIYPGQIFAYTKSTWIHIHPDIPVAREKGHLSYGLLKWWVTKIKNRK